MLRKQRKDEGETGGARPVMPFMLTNADALVLKAIMDAGGDKGFVKPARASSPSMLRRLREAELIELADDPRHGLCARLTMKGLTQIPAALKLLAAAGMVR